jgi:hypothetical protein
MPFFSPDNSRARINRFLPYERPERQSMCVVAVAFISLFYLPQGDSGLWSVVKEARRKIARELMMMMMMMMKCSQCY